MVVLLLLKYFLYFLLKFFGYYYGEEVSFCYGYVSGEGECSLCLLIFFFVGI